MVAALILLACVSTAVAILVEIVILDENHKAMRLRREPEELVQCTAPAPEELVRRNAPAPVASNLARPNVERLAREPNFNAYGVSVDFSDAVSHKIDQDSGFGGVV